LDPLPGFKEPPPGYGEVAFFWWLGDPLTKERLSWQLDRLAGKGVMGLQINYAHSDRGGGSWGLTYPSDPPLFSEAWWQLVGWFMAAAKTRGMAVSLSDYTLGIGQGWSADEVLREEPGLAGSVLRSRTKEVGPGPVRWEVPADVLSVVAIDPSTGAVTDLRDKIAGGALEWTAPGLKQRLVAVFAETVRPSIDPMNPRSGPAYAEKFFGQFERRFPGEAGRGAADGMAFGLPFRKSVWIAIDIFIAEFYSHPGC